MSYGTAPFGTLPLGVGQAAATGNTVAITGNAATASAGNLAASISVLLSGNQATGSVGTLAASISLALSGNAGTIGLGNLAGSISLPLSGNQATGSVGNLEKSLSLQLSGNQATGSVGTIASSISLPISGNDVTGSVGNLDVAGAVSVAITGNQSTASVGTLAASSPVVSVSGIIEGAGSGKYKERKRKNLSDEEIWIQFESLKSQFKQEEPQQEITLQKVDQVRNKIEKIQPVDNSVLIMKIENAQRMLDEIETIILLREIERENDAIEALLLAA